jgi:hypothetical protein
LAQQTALLSYFAANYGGVRDTFGGSNPLNFQQRGVSGRGWEFVDVPPVTLLSKEGMPTTATARIMLIKAGADAFPIVGVDVNARHCLDEFGDKAFRWQRLYYSLELKGAAPADNPLAKAVVGDWKLGSSTGVSMDTFTADGRYKSTSGTRTYSDWTPTTVKETTHTYFGDGRYEVHGDRLTLIPDNGQPATTQWVRVVTEPNSATPSGWLTTLYQLKLGYEGVPYEVGMRSETR